MGKLGELGRHFIVDCFGCSISINKYSTSSSANKSDIYILFDFKNFLGCIFEV